MLPTAAPACCNTPASASPHLTQRRAAPIPRPSTNVRFAPRSSKWRDAARLQAPAVPQPSSAPPSTVREMTPQSATHSLSLVWVSVRMTERVRPPKKRPPHAISHTPAAPRISPLSFSQCQFRFAPLPPHPAAHTRVALRPFHHRPLLHRTKRPSTVPWICVALRGSAQPTVMCVNPPSSWRRRSGARRRRNKGRRRALRQRICGGALGGEPAAQLRTPRSRRPPLRTGEAPPSATDCRRPGAARA